MRFGVSGRGKEATVASYKTSLPSQERVVCVARIAARPDPCVAICKLSDSHLLDVSHGAVEGREQDR